MHTITIPQVTVAVSCKSLHRSIAASELDVIDATNRCCLFIFYVHMDYCRYSTHSLSVYQ